MTYFEWNKGLYEHFFKNEVEVIYLSVTKAVLAKLSGLEADVAFKDFTDAVRNFPNESHDAKIAGFRLRLGHKGLIRRAYLLMEMWRDRNAYRYSPGPNLTEIPFFRQNDPPPYLAILASLVLMSENTDVESEAFWPTFNGVFPRSKGNDYMNDILDLFKDLQRHNPKFDHFSIYDVRRAVGTIYAQNPIKDKDVWNLTGFFQAKEIESIEAGSLDDDSLMELLREELDETIVNRFLLEAILSEDGRYERFKTGLPGILRERIGKYEIDEDAIVKAQEAIGERISAIKHEVLYCFDQRYLRPNLPFRFLIETGINSPLNEQAQDGILSINAGGGTSQVSISYSAKTTSPKLSENMTPFDGRIHKVDCTGRVISSNRPQASRYCMLFTPAGHDFDLNGWFVERRQGVLMAGERAYLLHKEGDANAEELLKKSEWTETQLSPGALPEGWMLRTILSWTAGDRIGNFRLSREKGISLSGGVRRNTRTNDFYRFCPPLLHVRNASADSELLLAWEGHEKSVPTRVASNILRSWPEDWPPLQSGGELVVSVAGENRSEVRIRLHEPGMSRETAALEYQDGALEGHNPIAREVSMDAGNRRTLQTYRYAYREEGGVAAEFETPSPRNLISSDTYDGTRDRLLAILSDRGVFSRRGFMTIAERLLEFLPEIEGDVPGERPEHLLEALLEQGHIRPDRGIHGGTERFRVISPTLCLLPDGENRYLLTGARNEAFMEEFRNAAKEDGREVVFENSHHPLMPQTVTVCIGTWNLYQRIAKLMNVKFDQDFKNPAGIRLLNGMRALHPEDDGMAHLQLHAGRLNDPYLFDAESLGWMLVTEKEANQMEQALVEIRGRRRGAAPPRPFGIKLEGGWRFGSDRSEAVHLFLANCPVVQSCIYYDRVTRRMAVPMGVKLPFEVRRALHLSGCFSSTWRVKSTGFVNRYGTVIHSRRPQINGDVGLVAPGDGEPYCTIAVYENVHHFIRKTIEWIFKMEAVNTNIQLQNTKYD
jgi:hypothetical protein